MENPFATSSVFLEIKPDVRLHLPTLDMLCAATGSRVYVFDREARYLYASAASAAIFGLTPQDMIGKTIYEFDFPAESNRRLEHDLKHVFASGQAAKGENRVDTPQGERAVAYTLHPLGGGNGEINAVAVTAMDITPLKQAETELRRKQEEVEALNSQLRLAMTETHHRVKNNLQLVAAMIDMRLMQNTSVHKEESENGDELVCSSNDMRRLSACVRTLAIVHDILTHESKAESRTSHVSTRPMLSRLLPLMQEATATRRIKSRLDDARLPVRHSTSLALIINELVSNALKYGRGDIEVLFTARDGRARLETLDDGPGFPPDFNASVSANTGLELVDNLTRLDLHGTVRYANRPEGGGHVTISMPLPPE